MKSNIALLTILLVPTFAGASLTSSKFQGQKIAKGDVAIYTEFQLKVGDVIISYNDKPVTTK